MFAAQVLRGHDRFAPLSPAVSESGAGDHPQRGERALGVVSRAFHELQRIGELERKIGQLTMENDFLKKACEHFRDHHPPAVVSGEAACLKTSGKQLRKDRGKS